MQVIDRNKALAIPPLLRLAFRPFFLGGSLLALRMTRGMTQA